jgi:hypothetical protein
MQCHLNIQFLPHMLASLSTLPLSFSPLHLSYLSLVRRRNTTLMMWACCGSFLCSGQLSEVKFSASLPSIDIPVTKYLCTLGRLCPSSKPLLYGDYLQCLFYTFGRHFGCLYSLLNSGSNLLVPVKFLPNKSVILSPLNFYCLFTDTLQWLVHIIWWVLFNCILQLLLSPWRCNIPWSVTFMS